MSCKDSWSPDEIDNLINLVRQFSDIYDQSKSGHSNINNIDSLWSKISNNLETKTRKLKVKILLKMLIRCNKCIKLVFYLFILAQQCKKKWQILRSRYRQRRHHSTPSGSGATNTPKWVYFDALSFLEPFLTERKTSSNIW